MPGPIVAVLAACGPVAVPPTLPEPAACVVAAGASAPAVRFAITHPVDPATAPVPRNASERVVFAQLYETLVDINCAGRVVPALAASWSAQEGGRVWVLRLRADATFSDNAPVTASDVLNSWARNAVHAPGAHALLASATAPSAAELRVELRSPTSNPALFAHPAFAVARPLPGAAWPIGSTSFRAVAQDDAGRAIRISARSSTPRTIEFSVMPNADARRALDAGADALITADGAVLEYARALPGYSITPLTWSRTYALASQPQSEVTVPPEELQALARDAVRGDARAAEHNGACSPQPTVPLNVSRTPSVRSIVYLRDDPMARDIAERLVALAWPAARAPAWLHALLPVGDRDGAPAALAVDARTLIDMLRFSAPHAYVIALARTSAGDCSPVGAGDAVGAALAASALHITPLVDARDQLVHRTGLGRIVVDAGGTTRFRDRSP